MRKTMYLEVKYTSDFDDKSFQVTKEEKEERKRVIEYLRELIGLDVHETYKLKIKELKNDTNIT